ncbi:MAG: hypothetical protein ACR2O4_00890 [Hyphomicrobiaceae bacterium]
MRVRILAAGLAATATIAIAASPAQSNVFASMHKTKVVNGRVCMIDHPHHRDSGAWRTKAQAKARAIRAWESYTQMEYGRAWSNYRIAMNKKLKCSKVSGGQTSCTLSAHPCRY